MVDIVNKIALGAPSMSKEKLELFKSYVMAVFLFSNEERDAERIKRLANRAREIKNRIRSLFTNVEVAAVENYISSLEIDRLSQI